MSALELFRHPSLLMLLVLPAALLGWIWQRKAQAWQNLNLTLVTPSHWLAECAKSSSLFEKYSVKVIANGLDPDVYKPLDRSQVRDSLNLPQNKHLVLFGAMQGTEDRWKGFPLLVPGNIGQEFLGDADAL